MSSLACQPSIRGMRSAGLGSLWKKPPAAENLEDALCDGSAVTMHRQHADA